MSMIFLLAPLALVVSLLGAARSVEAAQPAGTMRASDILFRFDAAQRGTTTLRVRFTQEKRSSLTKNETDVSRGTFYLEKPNRLLLRYEEPKPAYYLLTDGRLLVYYPELKIAQETRLPNRRVFKRFMRYFGMGEASEHIVKFFEVAVKEGNLMPDTFYLEMTPRKRRLEKHVAEARLWVDRETYLPRRVEMVEEAGDFLRITLEHTERNVDLRDAFLLKIPPDVKVEKIKASKFEGL
jgi:outer membrane lipoprotein-sorting protein